MSHERQCGPCQMCCTMIAVKPLHKPAATRCEHQCDTGCAIYAERPSCCAQYQCSWLEGNLPESMRPDLCGFLGETFEFPRSDGATLIQMTVLMGGPASDHAQSLGDWAWQRHMVIVDEDSGCFYGPDDLVAEFSMFMDRVRRNGVILRMADGDVQVPPIVAFEV